MSGGGLILLLLYLLVERIFLSQIIREIPLRICVTGTRGKSSVTRLIAGALREKGLKVLAKTTGSKPMLIFPEGTEKEIHRRGSPSILEGKDVLKTAAKLGARAVVAEMMSIQSETIAAESAHLFRPHILVITNVRPDHLVQMGKTKEDIARCFASAIPESCAVFVLEDEFFPVYQDRASGADARIIRVPKDAHDFDLKNLGSDTPFVQDVQLSLAVAEFIGVDSQTALTGMKKARQDFGSLKAWKFKDRALAKSCVLVSAFAANDPESTKHVLEYLGEKDALLGKKRIALLNFRRDRGDRTQQWLKAMQQGFLSDFDRIVLLGGHSQIVNDRLKTGSERPHCIARTGKSPFEIMADAVFQEEENVVVGMGNMGGMGSKIVHYWEEVGEPYDL